MSQRGPATAADVQQLGLVEGMIVEELGWDDDVDDDFRQLVMESIDSDLLEDAPDAVDAIILWLREEDGDVMELLVDALTDLGPGGFLWVMTPKIGRPGHVPQSDLAEGVVAAGLSLTTTATVSKDWSAHRIVRPKGTRR